MKKALLYPLVLILQFLACSVQAQFNVIFVNPYDEPILVNVLYVSNGQEISSPTKRIAPRDSNVVIPNAYSRDIAWYAQFEDSLGADYQFHGDTALAPYASPSKSEFHPLLRPRTNRYNAESDVYWNPLVVAEADSFVVIRPLLRSRCKGRCWYGAGSLFNYKEQFDVTWTDSLPDGRGILRTGDWVFDGAWLMGHMNGYFVIRNVRTGYLERGNYVNGLRDEAFHHELGNGDWIDAVYAMGSLNGKWVQSVENEVARGMVVNGKIDWRGSHTMRKT